MLDFINAQTLFTNLEVLLKHSFVFGDSVFDYLNNRRPGTSTLIDLARLTADVNAVIDLDFVPAPSARAGDDVVELG